MLHLLAQASLSDEVMLRVAAGDDVLLQGSAVWAAFRGHADNPKVLHLLGLTCRIYALQDWLTVNGIALDQLLTGVEAIDYGELVVLTEQNPVIATWC
ncbi:MULTISPECIES: DsrH/TusB family sulfur metabolism protein [Methylomonas]|uniref:DsrH/TusB family sulfur metabolism protein n=1 Tax=Methylomonas TaxID=416 RepID=UPI0012322C84|nr:DsrH/TusB family sulfur metabolism protein [Methylomonas rhizoryzae]